MITPGDVVCPKCGEDRSPTMITEIQDPMGQRYYCCMCAHEFKLPRITAADGLPVRDPRVKYFAC